MAARDVRSKLTSTPTVAAVGGHTRAAIDSVVTFNPPAGATMVEFCIEGAAARYTIGGTTPTITLGLILNPNQVVRYLIAPTIAIRVIGMTVGSFVNYAFYAMSNTNVVLQDLRNADD